jgi:hypothetical protein
MTSGGTRGDRTPSPRVAVTTVAGGCACCGSPDLPVEADLSPTCGPACVTAGSCVCGSAAGDVASDDMDVTSGDVAAPR